MVVLILITIITILLSSWYIGYYYKYERHLKQYSGPSLLAITVHGLFSDPLKDLLDQSMEFQRTYGPAVKIQSPFKSPVIQFSDPKLIEGVLGSTSILSKGDEYLKMESWLGTGLLTSGPTKWRKHRKILTPAFHFQILEQFIDTFNLYSETLVNKLKDVAGQDSIDIYPLVTLCSLDIICATSMGTAVNAQINGTSKYVRSVTDMTRIIAAKMVSLNIIPKFLYALTSTYWVQEKTLKILHDYTTSVISTRKTELQETSAFEKKHNNDLGIKERNTFLDTLLKYKLEGGVITDEEIREEVDTFMFEGHDTSSSALGFTLHSLANNQDVQKKVMEELQRIYGNDKDRPVTNKDLTEMKYLEMVIKESLRLYPSVPIYSRRLDRDTELNGSVLPKGVTVTIFAYGVHRNPQIYPEPEKFDPERFTSENQAKRSPYAYVPFSAGPRNCIGQKFAMLEIKTVISKVLRTFVLLPAIPNQKLVLIPELILKSSTGINIRLQERN